MKWYWAILFTIGILFLTLVISGLIGLDLTVPLILATAIWAAIDSGKIELRKYKSGISYSPVIIFIVLLLLWIAGFPWYLHVRYKIKNGIAELKEIETDVSNS